jgi:hypothetical protein
LRRISENLITALHLFSIALPMNRRLWDCKLVKDLWKDLFNIKYGFLNM